VVAIVNLAEMRTQVEFNKVDACQAAPIRPWLLAL
jgi:hypothetical protein